MPRLTLSTVLLAVLLTAGSANAVEIELSDRVTYLSGAINTKSITKVIKDVLKFEAQSDEPIWLMMNSFGGSVDAGFVLIDLMKSIQSPVHVVVTSKAYSMGAIITVYAQKRYIYPHATMMFHEASYGALGEDPSIRSRIEFNMKYLDRIHAEIAAIIQMPVAKYRERIRDAWWVLAEDAVKAKFVDGVVTKVSYRTLSVETTEIKKTTIIKKKRVRRHNPGSGPMGIN